MLNPTPLDTGLRRYDGGLCVERPHPRSATGQALALSRSEAVFELFSISPQGVVDTRFRGYDGGLCVERSHEVWTVTPTAAGRYFVAVSPATMASESDRRNADFQTA